MAHRKTEQPVVLTPPPAGYNPEAPTRFQLVELVELADLEQAHVELIADYNTVVDGLTRLRGEFDKAEDERGGLQLLVNQLTADLIAAKRESEWNRQRWTEAAAIADAQTAVRQALEGSMRDATERMATLAAAMASANPSP